MMANENIRKISTWSVVVALLTMYQAEARTAEATINANNVVIQRNAAISAAYEGVLYLDVPQVIPGRVEAEFFDMGGEGISYHNVFMDVDLPENVIRVEELGEPVEIQINGVAASLGAGGSEEDGEMATGMGLSGEWMRYTVDVLHTGTYIPNFRIATWDGADGPVEVSIKVVIGTGNEVDPCLVKTKEGVFHELEVNTGGWKIFETFEGTPISIPAGDHVLTICLDQVMNFEINYVQLLTTAKDIKFSEPPTEAATEAPTVAPTFAPTYSPTFSPTTAPTPIPEDEKFLNKCLEEGDKCDPTSPCCGSLICSKKSEECISTENPKNSKTTKKDLAALIGGTRHL